MNIVDLPITNAVNRPHIAIRPKYLVIHWTANTGRGANARANRNYFQNTERAASAHYCVDDREIIRCVPETEMAYHIGAHTYYHPEARNNNAIGIEMCVNSDGNFDLMRTSTVKLAADVCKRYGIDPMTHMLRHYDVTHKDCPRFFVQDPSAWERFKRDVVAEMTGGKREEVAKLPEVSDWKRKVHDDAKKNGLITSDWSARLDEPATVWFVLSVALNVLVALGKLKK